MTQISSSKANRFSTFQGTLENFISTYASATGSYPPTDKSRLSRILYL